MRAAALAAGALVVALAGCSGGQQGDGASTAPSASAPSSETASGSVLQAGDVRFDPVADDVAGTEVCDGLAGREELAEFDRAAWPELDVEAGDATLTCGNADGAGWRHIADGHTGDFQELADLVGASWEDVAWFAIDQALEQPTRVEEYRSDIVNYDVLVEYLGDDGEVERSWMVTVGVGLSTGTIITSFPDEQ